jgi:hypothetical protein
MKAHWLLYKDEWCPYEQRWGDRWRVDVRTDGVLANAQNQWWSCRIMIYKYIQRLIETHGGDEEKGLEAANEIYEVAQQGSKNPTNPPPVQLLSQYCRDALPNVGIKVAKGRPSKKVRPTHRSMEGGDRRNQQTSATGGLFYTNPSGVPPIHQTNGVPTAWLFAPRQQGFGGFSSAQNTTPRYR